MYLKSERQRDPNQISSVENYNMWDKNHIRWNSRLDITEDKQIWRQSKMNLNIAISIIKQKEFYESRESVRCKTIQRYLKHR